VLAAKGHCRGGQVVLYYRKYFLYVYKGDHYETMDCVAGGGVPYVADAGRL
jgi:hypothetical protein